MFDDEAYAKIDQLIDRSNPDPDTCWPWIGKSKAGKTRRPVFYAGKKRAYVSRALMERVLGRTLQSDEVVIHSCDNPQCCRIDHLSIGTQANNIQDMVAKGRLASGERNRSSKLSEEQVFFIRFFDVRPVKEIAKELSVSLSLIYRIKKGKGWVDIKPPKIYELELDGELVFEEMPSIPIFKNKLPSYSKLVRELEVKARYSAVVIYCDCKCHGSDDVDALVKSKNATNVPMRIIYDDLLSIMVMIFAKRINLNLSIYECATLSEDQLSFLYEILIPSNIRPHQKSRERFLHLGALIGV